MLVIEEHVVLHKLDSAVKLIQRSTTEGSSMTTMNYIGLDVHKKTISYRVKDVSGRGSSSGSKSEIVVHGDLDLLLRPQIPLGGLNR
jgi:hypothetical protein